MNFFKKNSIKVLIVLYNKFKFYKIRTVIKTLLKNDKISINYQGINLFVGVKSAIETGVLFDEYNEKEILKLISHFASKHYNLIDVGANIGIHSMIAAKSNKEIQIFSFEPEPNNFYNFMGNIGLNKFNNIKPFCFGVGNVIEEKILNINSGWNKGKHSFKNEFEVGSQKITLPIITLDSFKTIFSNKSFVIKIDVEGFEKEVVLGAESVLNNTKEILIIMELLSENNSVDSCEQIVQKLSKFGFEAIYKIEQENKFVKVDRFNGSADYVFVKGIETNKNINDYLVL